jgi:hypothetical protein
MAEAARSTEAHVEQLCVLTQYSFDAASGSKAFFSSAVSVQSIPRHTVSCCNIQSVVVRTSSWRCFLRSLVTADFTAANVAVHR